MIKPILSNTFQCINRIWFESLNVGYDDRVHLYKDISNTGLPIKDEIVKTTQNVKSMTIWSLIFIF